MVPSPELSNARTDCGTRCGSGQRKSSCGTASRLGCNRFARDSGDPRLRWPAQRALSPGARSRASPAPSARSSRSLSSARPAIALYSHPPMQNVGRGEIGVRANHLTGDVSEWRDGSVLVIPGLHDLRVYSLRDQTYQPEQIRSADGAAPLQSVEGLSFGVDLVVRYALDAAKRAHPVEEPARQHRRRNRRARGAGRDLQDLRPLHRARDLLDQTRRDPAGDRERSSRPSCPRMVSCCAACRWARWTCPPTTGAA